MSGQGVEKTLRLELHYRELRPYLASKGSGMGEKGRFQLCRCALHPKPKKGLKGYGSCLGFLFEGLGFKV